MQNHSGSPLPQISCKWSLRGIWGRGAGGEGASLLFDPLVDHFFNLFSDTKRILGHSKSIEAQNLVSLFPQELITLFVAEFSRFGEMVFAVHFNNQLQSETDKIDGIGWDRMLPSKLLATHS